jgi:CRISPR-associated protein Cas1
MEWVQGEWENSADTLQGNFVHRRVDRESGSLPENPDEDSTPFTARSVYMSAVKVGLTARMDLVEGDGRHMTPVDYKKGSMPDIPGGIWEPEKIQLCAQALILRENGLLCEEAIIWYAESRKRLTVPITPELVSDTLKHITDIRVLIADNELPLPLENSQKCPRCSLVGICLPDEVTLFRHKSKKKPDTRRLVAACQDKLPLHLVDQGAYLGLKGECMQVRKNKQILDNLRFLDLSSVSLYGNIQVSTQVLRELCSRNIPVSFFSYGGWFYGLMQGMPHKNITLRIRQFEASADPVFCLNAAAHFVNGKIMNCRTMIRRNHPNPNQQVLRSLNRMALKVFKVKSLEELLGVEGAAAQLYFSCFTGMFKKGTWHFTFTERNRRPPRDPVNCMLSYGYSMMTKDLTITAAKVGFDPYLGFYHQPRYGKPAIALDLMEEFRPLIVDSTVLSCINNEIIKEEDFIVRNFGVSMKEGARRKFIEAYSRRMETLITHPVFEYRISYRQVLEVQVRLFSRYLQNEIPEYPAFKTR